MKYIEENLRSLFAGHPKHPLDLKIRRPDLWTLELSCENTKTRIAQLDLVNEILENYIAQRRGYSGPLANRAAIGALVYEQTLAQVVDSFHQPFHLPLARIGACLAKLGHTRAEIAAAVGAKSTVRVQAELRLSTRERELLTTPDNNLGHLSHIYGLQFGGTASDVAAVDAQVFGPAMGLTRDLLGQVVGAGFIAAGERRCASSLLKRTVASVQNDVEWVEGLTADALDRLHRFTRLTRRVAWSVPELDLVLETLAETALGPSGLSLSPPCTPFRRASGSRWPNNARWWARSPGARSANRCSIACSTYPRSWRLTARSRRPRRASSTLRSGKARPRRWIPRSHAFSRDSP